MAITSSKDFGPHAARYQAQRDPDAVETDHPLNEPVVKVEGEHAGVTGGLTDAMREAEERRVANMPQVGPEADRTYHAVQDPEVHEADTSSLSPKEPPRHDRYADENTGDPTPERVVPSTPTNANPSLADAEPAEPVVEATAVVSEAPAGNASAGDWRDYAVSQGWERDEAEAWSRDELREHFTA